MILNEWSPDNAIWDDMTFKLRIGQFGLLDSKLNAISDDKLLKLCYVLSSIGVMIVDSGPQTRLTESSSTNRL